MTTEAKLRPAPLYTIEEVRAHGLPVPSEEELRRRRAVIDRTWANAARRHLGPGENTTAAIRRMRDEAAGIQAPWAADSESALDSRLRGNDRENASGF